MSNRFDELQLRREALYTRECKTLPLGHHGISGIPSEDPQELYHTISEGPHAMICAQHRTKLTRSQNLKHGDE